MFVCGSHQVSPWAKPIQLVSHTRHCCMENDSSVSRVHNPSTGTTQAIINLCNARVANLSLKLLYFLPTKWQSHCNTSPFLFEPVVSTSCSEEEPVGFSFPRTPKDFPRTTCFHHIMSNECPMKIVTMRMRIAMVTWDDIKDPRL